MHIKFPHTATKNVNAKKYIKTKTTPKSLQKKRKKNFKYY